MDTLRTRLLSTFLGLNFTPPVVTQTKVDPPSMLTRLKVVTMLALMVKILRPLYTIILQLLNLCTAVLVSLIEFVNPQGTTFKLWG